MSPPPAQAGRHLILAQSSLQFILAAALAEETRSVGGHCRLLFLPDILDPDLFVRAIDGWGHSPFESIQFITPRRSAGQAEKGRAASAVHRDIVAALKACAPSMVTVFNDRQDAGQTLLIETAKQFPQALRCCAEDGALAYTGFRYRAHGLVTRWRQRLRLGRGWSDVQVLGTHPLVQRYLAIHPELVRSELRGHVVETLPSALLCSPSLQAFARRLCQLTAFDTQGLGSAAVLLALGHASYAARNPDYSLLVRRCVERLVARGQAFFFKYHPRETAPDYLALAGLPLAQEVPRTLPVECLYLLARERPLGVVGGMSTSLLTAGLLMPGARIAALGHASNTGDTWSPALLSALRITQLQDAASLEAYLGVLPG